MLVLESETQRTDHVFSLSRAGRHIPADWGIYMTYLEERFEQANELLKIQGAKGNYDYSEYSRGLYNGMELILAIFEGRTPVYKESEGEDEDGQ